MGCGARLSNWGRVCMDTLEKSGWEMWSYALLEAAKKLMARNRVSLD